MNQPHQLGKITPTPTKNIRGSKDNPRVITKAAIDTVASSIQRFGWQQPIVTDTNGVILAGHTRHLAARQLGLATVPVVVADNLTEDEARAYRIADNRTGDFTYWDYPELVQQLEELSGDFGDELALADWESIVGEFENSGGVDDGASTGGGENGVMGGGGGREYGEPDNAIGSGETAHVDDSLSDYLNGEFDLVVVCEDEQAAAKVQAVLVEMREVVDVRYKRG